MSLLSRRQFLKSTSAIASLGSLLKFSCPSWAQQTLDLNDELQRQRLAKYTMVFASPYPSADWEHSPHMHQEIKYFIQEVTQGKVYVEIIDDGQAGVGTDLLGLVNRGVRTAALVSVSNLSPIAKPLNIINIPFWIKNDQSYLNLVTSSVFDQMISQKVRKTSNLDILFWYLPGFRTATTTKLVNKTIKKPDDIKGMAYRVPPSKVLAQFYELAGAIPRSIPWSKTSYAAQSNIIEGLDPGIIGLYNGPNQLREHLGTISEINLVYDGWAAVINQTWMNELDSLTRDQVKEAVDQVFREHLARIFEVKQNCSRDLGKLGTSIYLPSPDELHQWSEHFGHHRQAWLPVKKNIVGSEQAFEDLLRACDSSNGYTLPA